MTYTDLMMKKHKIDKNMIAACRTPFMGWVTPPPGARTRSWQDVTCKNCLAKRKMQKHVERFIDEMEVCHWADELFFRPSTKMLNEMLDGVVKKTKKSRKKRRR